MQYVKSEFQHLFDKNKIAFDVVIPNNNENEFIDMALKLGYKEIVFLSDKLTYDFKSDKIKVLKGFLMKKTSDIGKAKNFDFIFAEADRISFEQKIDFIFNAELSDREDSVHYRNTLLNQVHAKLAKQNTICIVFNFSLLLNNRSEKYLGRMMQNALLVRKYKLNFEVFSFAKKPLEMRSRTMLNSLKYAIGLN